MITEIDYISIASLNQYNYQYGSVNKKMEDF